MDKRLKTLIFILLAIFLFYFGADLLMSSLGKGYIYYIKGKPVLILGIAKNLPENLRVPYPLEVQASFKDSVTVKTEVGDFAYREPKYERAMKVIEIVGNTITGKDIETGETVKYLWTKNSGYSCNKGDYVQIGNQIIDPSLHPENMKFFFFGTGWRGILGNVGLTFLKEDLNTGDGAKVYLISENKDNEGRSEILNLMLFTSKENCVQTFYEPMENLRNK
ncbi:hypothetical protein HZA76_01950 [Candidatus Roizmanbacteria bacterium]|nr:hypothetical protein [Candidatus Roizmanbacteria bacterium]